MRISQADELIAFKTDIDLVAFAESYGYSIDKSDSGKDITVLRKGKDKADPKILVCVGADNHWVYKDCRDESKKGSIIDFVMNEKGLTLGNIRKELREFNGNVAKSSTLPRKKPRPVDSQRFDAKAAWENLHDYRGRYLQDERGLSNETISVFSSRIRQDDRGFVCFQHRDTGGITGFELKNKDRPSFSKGGSKALFSSVVGAGGGAIQNVVICEAVIDAMSHYQMFPPKATATTLYLATGGQPSIKQMELIKHYLSHPSTSGASIYIATDNDTAGDQLSEKIFDLCPDKEKVFRHKPEIVKDWNHALVHGDKPEAEVKVKSRAREMLDNGSSNNFGM